MRDPHYARLLREDADAFVLTVAVVAEDDGLPAYEVADEAIRNALARLQERGALGGTDKP